jgi:drug/metabolite transporter (DMT)-like permease
MTRHPLYGLAIAGFGALVLTPDTLFMRLSGLGGFEMMAWRGLLMGAALVLAWMLLAKGPKTRDLAALATGPGIVVVLAHATNASLFNLGIAVAPVSVVLFGVATVPVFSAILARLVIGEPTRPATWITIATVMAGISIAVFSKDDGGVGLDPATLLGALAGLGVAACLALCFVVLRARPGIPILPTMGTGATLSGLAGLAVAGPEAAMQGEIWAIAVSGAVILPVSFFALTTASRHTHASNVSLLLLLETIVGPAWVWLGTGEAPTRWMILGGAVVVTSLALYILHTSRSARRAAA